MKLYRVLAYNRAAGAREPGGALYVPPQGHGRIDNPEHYGVLYVGDAPAGVCAEAFNVGKYRTGFSAAMLRGHPSLPNSVRALVSYEVAEPLAYCNLDDPRELIAQSLRPSIVVTRDYTISQAWALKIFHQNRWAGVGWWSYHDGRWTSMGIWDRDVITDFDVEPLTIEHPAIAEAASVLSIPVVA